MLESDWIRKTTASQLTGNENFFGWVDDFSCFRHEPYSIEEDDGSIGSGGITGKSQRISPSFPFREVIYQRCHVIVAKDEDVFLVP